jgi:predicted transcriptional regulator
MSIPKVLDLTLVTAAALKKAVRIVAAEYGLPTGSVYVLAAVAARTENRLDCRPCHVYSAEIASSSLVREYLARLVTLGMVRPQTYGRMRYLALTGKGSLAAGHLQRQVRANTKALLAC